MRFNKSLLSAWVLAQALVQISVSADESKTNVQSYTDPVATNSVNGAVTTCNENGCTSILNNNASKCVEGTNKCIIDRNGYEHCINGKLEFTQCKSSESCFGGGKNMASCQTRSILDRVTDACSQEGLRTCNISKTGYRECNGILYNYIPCDPNQSCVTKDNTVQCDVISNNTCTNGEQKCISEKNGYEECVGGIKVFKECRINEFCVALNGPVAGCALRNDFKCNNGDKTCRGDSTGYDECVNNELVFHRCMNGLCVKTLQNEIKCAENNNTFNKDQTCVEGYKTCVPGKNGYTSCINGKSEYTQCGSNEACVVIPALDYKYIGRCDPINNYPTCAEGTSRCAVETSGSEICIDGKWVLRKCSGNEFCMITPENIAKCVDYNNIPICVEGTNRCAFDINGTETCVGGKFVLKNCGDNEKCEIINGNFAKCINHYPTCTEGTTRCAVGNLDSETCSNGKWVTRKCSGNELCKVGKDNVAKCTKIDTSVCTDGTTRCAAEGIDSETCSNGQWVRRKCSGNEECKITEGNIAKCVAKTLECEKGYQKCNNEQTGYDECVNGKLEFKSCGSNKKCFALNGFRILCGAVY
ncbi:hypothetical protein BB561_006643 [Smittium simulii]|uniref:Uncharacterized protein n=1 Tax=Smittium simulii TaxID=133385 RepID=A0A2T9Y2P4_9FUNG|nr:hypothetical protein BB561_006643 [Smittium simulii]